MIERAVLSAVAHRTLGNTEESRAATARALALGEAESIRRPAARRRPVAARAAHRPPAALDRASLVRLGSALHAERQRGRRVGPGRAARTADRARGGRSPLPADDDVERGHRGGALRLGEHDQVTRQEHLPQARRDAAAGRGSPRAAAPPALTLRHPEGVREPHLLRAEESPWVSVKRKILVWSLVARRDAAPADQFGDRLDEAPAVEHGRLDEHVRAAARERHRPHRRLGQAGRRAVPAGRRGRRAEAAAAGPAAGSGAGAGRRSREPGAARRERRPRHERRADALGGGQPPHARAAQGGAQGREDQERVDGERRRDPRSQAAGPLARRPARHRRRGRRRTLHRMPV